MIISIPVVKTIPSISFKMKVLIIILSLASIVQVSLVNGHVTDCSGPDAVGKLEELTVSGCDLENKPFCSFVQGTNETLTTKFKSLAPFSKAHVEIYGKLGAVSVPFPIRPSEACGNYGLKCPVPADEDNVISITLPILKQYPRFGLDIQFRLRDEQRKTILCIEFPVKIVKH